MVVSEAEAEDEEVVEVVVSGVGFRVGEREEGGGGIGPPIVMAET